MDPTRELGAFEKQAIVLLGEPLMHDWRTAEDRDKRDSQMRALYEDHGWSLADVGTAFDVSKEWVRQSVIRAGGATRPSAGRQMRRYPG